jgi:hypothetical protein
MLLFGFAMVLIMIWKPRGLIATRDPSVFLNETPHPTLQPKSDVSDFGQSMKGPNSGEPEFGGEREKDTDGGSERERASLARERHG